MENFRGVPLVAGLEAAFAALYNHAPASPMTTVALDLPGAPSDHLSAPEAAADFSPHAIAAALPSMPPVNTITVNSLLDNTTVANGQCTLRAAINNANTDSDATTVPAASAPSLTPAARLQPRWPPLATPPSATTPSC